MIEVRELDDQSLRELAGAMYEARPGPAQIIDVLKLIRAKAIVEARRQTSEEDPFVQIAASGAANVYALDNAGNVWCYNWDHRGSWVMLATARKERT